MVASGRRLLPDGKAQNRNIDGISSAAWKLSKVIVSSPSVMTASSPTCRTPALRAAKVVASTWPDRSILSASEKSRIRSSPESNGRCPFPKISEALKMKRSLS